MIDLHSHILAGVDDGAKTLDESVEIAIAAECDGISLIAATPHVRDDYPTSSTRIEKLVSALNSALNNRGISIRVLTGAEISLSYLVKLDDEELRALSLAGSGKYVLLEFPYYGWPLSLESDILRLRNRGFTPVIAHPERNLEVQADPERLGALIAAGALVQITAASVDGRLGRESGRCAKTLIESGLAHLIASDAHTFSIREVGLSDAARTIDDVYLARWLTNDVPESIVAGKPIPERPKTKSRRKVRHSFRGSRRLHRHA